MIREPEVAQAASLLNQGVSVLRARKVLEQRFCPSVCLALLDCLSCRIRFATKFEQANRWFLTREAAEQASHQRVAQWRAQALARFLPGPNLTEIGCGIGGDSVYLSRLFSLTCYEKDSARALLAEQNLAEMGGGSWQVNRGEVDPLELRCEALFVDPARRDHARLSSPDDWSPPLNRLVSAHQRGHFRQLAVKCAPGIQTDYLEKLGSQMNLFFISVAGELKEALLIINPPTGGEKIKRHAILLGESETLELASADKEPSHGSPESGLYLHNPNPALLRARALGQLSEMLEAGAVHPQIGYLVGPRPAPADWAQSFLIEEHFSLNWDVLKKKLLARPWSEYEYLGRGVPFSQSEVRAKLPRLKKKKTPLRGNVIIYREDRGYRVVLAQRVAGKA